MRNRTHNKVWRKYEGKRMYNAIPKTPAQTEKTSFYVDVVDANGAMGNGTLPRWGVVQDLPIGSIATRRAVLLYPLTPQGYTDALEEAERLNAQ